MDNTSDAIDPEQVTITPALLVRAGELYDKGLYLQALRFTEKWGPLPSWQGPEAMVFACRLARQLGGIALSRWLIRRAWKQYPHHNLVRYFYAHTLIELRGPYALWRWMHEQGELSPEASDELRAEWFALLGMLASWLRDFEAADEWLCQADRLAPSHAWIKVCQATSLEQEDRYADALAAAQAALKLRPWYCPAVESQSHLLTIMGCDTDAVALLTEALKHTESLQLVAQLYALQIELRQYETAKELLERCEELTPFAERPLRRWLAGQRSDVAYYLGDISNAVTYAKQGGRAFYDLIAARLEKAKEGEFRHRLLPVGFVRQHQMTCVPATLSAISRFWSQSADHLQVAEEICYNGTSSYNERHWAETHGWLAREFTITEPSAAALLDRGVPFTFSTVEPTSAHLQAVIGYDDHRGTFWIRDPYWRNAREVIADKTLEQYRAFGPRGMALVPAVESERIKDLDLPDAPLWDMLHELDGALIAHRRDQAVAIYERMRQTSDGHRLNHLARLRLACYDANSLERLAAVEGLMQMTPDDPCLDYQRVGCLQDLARRDERLALFEKLCEKREVAPVFLQQYAQELRGDARRHGEVIKLLNRVLRRAPREAGGYRALADVLWSLRRFEEAFELYRFATCLDDKDETLAETYFRAARWFKKTEEALAFLRERYDRFGKRSSFPARTLVQAYLQCDRPTEAIAALNEAMRLRPEDGELILFAADTYLTCSSQNLAMSGELLAKAKDKASRTQWIRTAARLAAQDDRPAEALELWKELLELQPLATDAHQAIVQLLVETQGKAAALIHLDQAVASFPHFLPLQQLLLQWVGDEPAEVREAAIRRALDKIPHDAWLHRELGFFLVEQRRLQEASRETDIAGALEPNVPTYCFLRAQLLREEGRFAEAKVTLREAIRLSVDYRPAIDESMSLCASMEERREFLAFFKEELVRQVTFGDAIMVFRNIAHNILEPEELLKVLQESLKERSDLWCAWSACVQQLMAMDRRDEATRLAEQATDRFPLLPPLWLDRAAAYRALQNGKGERESLETAYQINPDWGESVRSLADFFERQGDYGKSLHLFEKAATRQPQDAITRTLYAECLWRQQNREAAFEQIQKIIVLNPGVDRAWNDLKAWAGELGRHEIVLEVARKLTETRPGEARSWFLLARFLDAPERWAEQLQSLDKAIELSPRLIAAHDERAIALANAERWEESRNACFPAVWEGNLPVELRGRANWILAMQGKLPEAVAEMRTLLAEEPGYYTGWCWMWDWCRAIEDYKGCLEAGEGMMLINPQYEICLGYLAEAHRLNSNLGKAKEFFQRAFNLNPRYDYAGCNLFDLQLADGQTDSAAATLARLRQFDDNPFLKARAVQLAARQALYAARKQGVSGVKRIIHFLGKTDSLQQKYKETALAQFRLICINPCDGPWPVSTAVDALISAGWRPEAEDILRKSMMQDNAPVDVGCQWIRLSTERGQWRCGKQLRDLIGRGEIGVEATVDYINRLVAAKKWPEFSKFWRKHKTWLSANDRTWGSTGYALVSFHKHSKMISWMSDWRTRKNVEAWMLLNLVEGLRARKLDSNAAEASEYALTLRPDQTHNSHRTWLAADALGRGEIEAARKMLDEISLKTLNEPFAFLAELIRAVADMASAAPQEKASVFSNVRRNLRLAIRQYQSSSRGRARRRFYRKCLRFIVQYHGGFEAKAWSWLSWLTS